MSYIFYRMRGRSGPVSESKFELKTLKVSNDTLNVSARLIFQLHAKNQKTKLFSFYWTFCSGEIIISNRAHILRWR